MADEIDALVARLRNPPFGTEISERNLFAAAADTIKYLRAKLRDSARDFLTLDECMTEVQGQLKKAEAERDETIRQLGKEARLRGAAEARAEGQAMTDIPLLETRIATLTKLLSDAEWDGNDLLAARLREDVVRLRARVEQGETYDPDF